MLVELQGIEHAFSKPSLVSMISKVTQNWYSIYQLTHWFTLQNGDFDVFIEFCVDSTSINLNQKVQCTVVMRGT